MVVKLCEHYNVRMETEIKAAGYEPSNVRSTYVEGGTRDVEYGTPAKKWPEWVGEAAACIAVVPGGSNIHLTAFFGDH